MLEFIIKYWVTWAFGIIALGMSFLAKRYIDLLKKEKEHKSAVQKQEIVDLISNKLEIEIKHEHEQLYQKDDKIYAEVDDLRNLFNAIKEGLLIMYTLSFKPVCREALKKSHTLTLEEYEDITEGYRGYKMLGGNHQGDELYHMVQERAKRHFLIEEKNGEETL